jgi:hypothetical protein
MEEWHLEIYLRELEKQCKFLLIATDELESGLKEDEHNHILVRNTELLSGRRQYIKDTLATQKRVEEERRRNKDKTRYQG